MTPGYRATPGHSLEKPGSWMGTCRFLIGSGAGGAR